MQYGKVELCGVNTARLRVMTEDEKMERLRLMRSGDEKAARRARQELVEGNLRLVLSVIQRFSGRSENPDDLFQVGCIGLMKAIDHFDISQGVRFSTYGVPMIIGEIRRYLRDNNAVRVSRSLRDMAYKAMQMKEKLTREKNREPTVEEIAKGLEQPVESVVTALEAIAHIKRAGGIAVIAHPGIVAEHWNFPAWTEAGLDGVEVFYPAHTFTMRQDLLAITRKYGLIATGGSDYHGPHGGRNSTPGMQIPQSHYDKLLRKLFNR